MHSTKQSRTRAIRMIALVTMTFALARPTYAEPSEMTDAETQRSLHQANLISLWDAATAKIDVGRIKSLAAGLENVNSRSGAQLALKAETGIDLSQTSIQKQTEQWKKYASALERFVAVGRDKLTNLEMNHSARGKMLTYYGEESPHPAFLPLLRAIAESPLEQYYVRYMALTAISQTPHADVVEYLMGFLGDDSLRFRAWEQLEKLTKSAVLFRNDDSVTMRTDYQQWWAEHKKAFRYIRSRVLEER
jgi:hypothetical protein